MPLPNFPSPHVHIQSLDSASTPKAFVKREKELGTGVLTVTDHGTLQCCRQVYDLARKNGLTPILGVEAYFRDDNCPILKAGGIQDIKEYAKYYHITLHAIDQPAYEALVRVLSRASLNRMEKHGSEYKPLFDWNDLRELAQFNITFTTGCLVGMVQRHYLNGRPDLAEAYYAELQKIVPPGNLYVEVFPHKTDKNWISGVFVTFDDGTKQRWYAGKTLKVDGKEVKAEQLAKDWKDDEEATCYLEGVKNRNTWEMFPAPGKGIKNVEHVEDYIENECIPDAADSDSQKWCNIRMIDLASRSAIPILISDDAHFATEDEKVIQDVRLRAGGNSWRFYASYHRYTSDEALAHFKESLGPIVEPQDVNIEEEFTKWLDNNIKWAARFRDFKFKDRRELPTKFYPENTIEHLGTLIEKHGRMNWDSPEHVARLQTEVQMLRYNGTIDLLPYFFVCEEALGVYEQAKKLTGPGRGSAAGLLLSYLLGITHIDPLKYDLSMERFLTLDRIKGGKLPDIDMDLPSRQLLVDEENPNRGWLRERFGDCVAQISTDTSLKIRSSILDVARVRHNGVVPDEIAKLAHNIDTAPQGVEDRDFIFGYEGPGGWEEGSIEHDEALQKYVQDYPDEWELVQKLLGLTRQKSRHACAYVVTNEPVSNFIPLTKIGDYIVTQYTAKSVEAAGGLKMDFLVINILNDIQRALDLIQKRSGLTFEDKYIDGKLVPAFRQIPLNGNLYDVWDLPENLGVLNDISESKTETVFQLNTNGARQYLRLFNFDRNDHSKGINNIEAIAAFTALDRPGPLDAYVEKPDGKRHNMLVEYANRAKGEEAVNPLAILQELLPETYGVIVYQEQLQRIYHKLGKTTPAEADDFRAHVGKKYQGYEQYRVKDRDVFMKGAVESVGQETAEALWDQMYTFGQYGFNKSHAVSYGIIGYVCAWLKHFYPLEWWTAVLSNADRNEIDEKFWRYCWDKVLMPDIALSGEKFEIENNKIRAPLSFLYGVGKAAHTEIMMGRPYKDIMDFVQKIQDRRMRTGKIVLDKKGNEKLKLGYSALHRGIVYSLIISGTMDSLFPSDSDIFQKLEMYEQALATVTGKKQKAIPEKYIKMNQMTRFQLRKQILPAYAEPILPMVVDRQIQGITYRPETDGYYYKIDDEEYRLVTYSQLERLGSMKMLPEGGISIAIAAYITSERRFTYKKNGEKHQACELQIDHDGGRFKSIRWAGRGGKLPKDFPADNMSGALAILILNRWNEKKPDFTIEKAIIVQEPLVEDKEEESK